MARQMARQPRRTGTKKANNFLVGQAEIDSLINGGASGEGPSHRRVSFLKAQERYQEKGGQTERNQPKTLLGKIKSHIMNFRLDGGVDDDRGGAYGEIQTAADLREKANRRLAQKESTLVLISG